MNYRNLTFQTDKIPVYSVAGKKEHEILLPEKITPIVSKRGGFSESGLYYKGRRAAMSEFEGALQRILEAINRGNDTAKKDWEIC